MRSNAILKLLGLGNDDQDSSDEQANDRVINPAHEQQLAELGNQLHTIAHGLSKLEFYGVSEVFAMLTHEVKDELENTAAVSSCEVAAANVDPARNFDQYKQDGLTSIEKFKTLLPGKDDALLTETESRLNNSNAFFGQAYLLQRRAEQMQQMQQLFAALAGAGQAEESPELGRNFTL